MSDSVSHDEASSSIVHLASEGTDRKRRRCHNADVSTDASESVYMSMQNTKCNTAEHSTIEWTRIPA